MKKMVTAAVTALFAVSLASFAFADDITVRTSVGDGEVIFTETSEAVDVSAQELTELVKEALRKADELEVINGFVDAEAAVTLKFDEENQMDLNASAIFTMDKNGDDAYSMLVYSLDGFGDPAGGRFESYHWVEDGTHYSAVDDGNGWKVRAEDKITVALEELSDAIDREEISNLTLNGLLPNLYEEDGEKYYVCVYDKDTVMETAGGIEGVDLYAAMADGILGDNDVTLTVVINAQNGLPRAVSLNASGASGQLPGELLGGEGSFEFSADDLYVTLLSDTYANEIEIPEDVLNVSVETEAEGLDLDLGNLLGAVGLAG